MNIITKVISVLILTIALLSGSVLESGATHISKAVLHEARTDYILGEKVVLSGWADYNDQPTSDVQLNVKVFQPDGSEIMDKSFISDEQGYFRFEIETENWLPGVYQIVITSQCREAHRQICSYQSEALSIQLRQ